jgi:peptidylprolyl isomerase
MTQAKQGDRVRINFTGKLDDGTIFDTTYETDDSSDEECEAGPIEFTIGEEEFFIQAEQALIGMSVGEQKSVAVPAADAFGEYEEALVFKVERSQLPAGMDPGVDEELELIDENEETLFVTVVETTDDSITIDANHPLSGQPLTFDLELVAIL